MLSLGVYPDTPLKRAREKRDEARKLVAEGKDPSAARKQAKAALADTFEGVALEWFNKHKAQWLDSHSSKVWARLEKNVFPYIGQHPIGGLRAGQVRAVLDRIVARGEMEEEESQIRKAALSLLTGQHALRMDVVGFPSDPELFAANKTAIQNLGKALESGALQVEVKQAQ